MYNITLIILLTFLFSGCSSKKYIAPKNTKTISMQFLSSNIAARPYFYNQKKHIVYAGGRVFPTTNKSIANIFGEFHEININIPIQKSIRIGMNGGNVTSMGGILLDATCDADTIFFPAVGKSYVTIFSINSSSCATQIYEKTNHKLIPVKQKRIPTHYNPSSMLKHTPIQTTK